LALKTLGDGGNIGAFVMSEFENIQNLPSLNGNTFEFTDNYFIRNITKNYGVWASRISIENRETSYSSSSPETISEIVNSSTGVLQSQYRNVTRTDYNKFLETYPDVVKANS
jgi:HSP90 family molecular chaperone